MMSAWDKRAEGEEEDVVVADSFIENDAGEDEEEEAPEIETEDEDM